MDIMSLSSVASSGVDSTMSDVEMAVLDNAMETDKIVGENMAAMLEHSVTPYKGGFVDVRV